MSEDDLYELKDEPWMLKRVFTGEDFIETPTIGSSIEERIDKLAEKFYTLRYEGESTAYVRTKSFMRSALTELAADLQAEHEKEVAELRAWKESALKVMPDFQKLGKLLGLPLGSDASKQLIPAVETLTKEVAELRETARALVEKLREIHDDPRYQSVWFCAANHGIPYTGPKYDKELEQLEQLLTRLGGSSK